MELLEALKRLDHDNDDHWTGDGAPRLDALSPLLGSRPSRKEVLDAAPHFIRGTSLEKGEAVEPEEEEADEDSLETLNAQLADIHARIGKLKARQVELEKKQASLYSPKPSSERARDNQIMIMAHLRKHNARRLAEAKARNEALRALNPNHLGDPRSPLDQAIAAKNKRRG